MTTSVTYRSVPLGTLRRARSSVTYARRTGAAVSHALLLATTLRRSTFSSSVMPEGDPSVLSARGSATAVLVDVTVARRVEADVGQFVAFVGFDHRGPVTGAAAVLGWGEGAGHRSAPVGPRARPRPAGATSRSPTRPEVLRPR